MTCGLAVSRASLMQQHAARCKGRQQPVCRQGHAAAQDEQASLQGGVNTCTQTAHRSLSQPGRGLIACRAGRSVQWVIQQQPQAGRKGTV